MPRLLETLRFEKVGINVVVFFGVLFGIFVLRDSGKIYDALVFFSVQIDEIRGEEDLVDQPATTLRRSACGIDDKSHCHDGCDEGKGRG